MIHKGSAHQNPKASRDESSPCSTHQRPSLARTIPEQREVALMPMLDSVSCCACCAGSTSSSDAVFPLLPAAPLRGVRPFVIIASYWRDPGAHAIRTLRSTKTGPSIKNVACPHRPYRCSTRGDLDLVLGLVVVLIGHTKLRTGAGVVISCYY